ncbi:MAG: hypothetical protein MK101_09320, partial [Phycisphaerales bacterium]|nr:hypothetical protein [Phycisphaerales bacterium]
MANSKITFWERYTEFLVLGLVAVAFIVLLAMQFIGAPNAYSSRGSEPIAPGAINGKLQEAASRLDAQLKQDGLPAGIGEADNSDLAAAFAQGMTQHVGPTQPVTLAYAPRGSLGSETTSLQGTAAVVVPGVPTPTMVDVYQVFDTLDDTVISTWPDLAQRYPDGGPYDVTWLTVAAKFDASALLSQWRTPQGDARGIPDRWFDARVDVVDVRIERRTQLADGSWSAPELIDLLPGAPEFREGLTKVEDITDRDMLIDGLRRPPMQRLVMQPDFLLTKSARWMTPEAYQARGQEASQLTPLEALRRLMASKRRIEQELEGLGGGFGGGGPGGGGPGGGGPGGGGGFGPGGGGGGGGFGPGGGG